MDIAEPVANDDYIRIAGTLTNTHDDVRAIDLGFALPIKDDQAQVLDWYYDMGNSIRIAEAEELDRTMPFTFTGPIDGRPETTSTRMIPTTSMPGFPGSGFSHNHNQQISVYSISSLGIEIGGVYYGLAFGDDLENPTTSNAPSISHFGYRIVHPGSAAGVTNDGYYFVEFNIGLLPAQSAYHSTDFSFIIFRSDNPDSVEISSFRDGLEKYQKIIFPEYFQRPVLTGDQDWLFGGGFFSPEKDEENPSQWDRNGFTSNPNQFGFRYTQDQSDFGGFGGLLLYCAGNDVGCQIYDLPWGGKFDPLEVDDRHTYAQLNSALSDFVPENYLEQITYGQKKLEPLRILPSNQDIFSSGPYRFPVYLARSPEIDFGGPVVTAELTALDLPYTSIASTGRCFSGLQFDVTFNFENNGNHLDLTSTRMPTFVSKGGRLTYSFNHFKPAIPQLCTNVWFFPHVRDFLATIDESQPYGDNDNVSAENQEQEIISINAHESKFGGSKYGIINADVIGFESGADKLFNNSSHSFNFRRSMARDKSVARIFAPLDCCGEVRTMFDDVNGTGPANRFWRSSIDLARQIYDEVSWIALAWGFHPSIEVLFPDSYFGGEERFDLFIERDLRERFSLNDGGPAYGYTEIFRQLHKSGWRPETNVVNAAGSTTAPGDPSKLYIERFGPSSIPFPLHRPVYVTLLNNNNFKVSLTDVVDFDSDFGVSICELETDLEVEQSDICQGKYGEEDEYDSKDKNRIEEVSALKDKNFYLVFSNLDEMTLAEGNLHGLQMIQSIEEPPEDYDAVNYPTIVADEFNEWGWNYSIIRYNHNTQLRLGGQRLLGSQDPGIIEDKALMVFKIWATTIVDNGDQGGDDGRSELVDPYYQRFGNWTTVSDETARAGTADVVSSYELGAYALFSVDIAGNARYDVQVTYPENPNGTSAALFEVYLREEYVEPETGEVLESVIGEPLLTTVLDQSSRDAETMDDERFVSIGEIEAQLGSDADRLSVVVKVSSAGAEQREGRQTLLLADAVRVVNLDR